MSKANVKTNGMGSTIAKSRVYPMTALFFKRNCFISEPLIKSWFDVPTTQMSIFTLFVTSGVLFETAFSLTCNSVRVL